MLEDTAGASDGETLWRKEGTICWAGGGWDGDCFWLHGQRHDLVLWNTTTEFNVATVLYFARWMCSAFIYPVPEHDSHK